MLKKRFYFLNHEMAELALLFLHTSFLLLLKKFYLLPINDFLLYKSQH